MWQPIETAPEDIVLLLYEAQNDYIFTGGFDADCGEWVETGRGCYTASPTHWMPLPAPPNNEQQEW